MKPFIKVIEIWTPDTRRERLVLSDSYFGEYENFNRKSQDIAFSFNEGLPGMAWAQSSPIIITDLDHSCFVRKQAARDAGIVCAVAIPVFAGQYLLAVVILLCGDSKEYRGAIEIWGKRPDSPDSLQLVDGYYHNLARLEEISRRTSFEKGTGFPGTIWDYHLPQIVSDMSSSESFMRASSAHLEGITTAFGIPFVYDKDHEFVLTFLSSPNSPIARRFEIWLPDREHTRLSLFSGHSEIAGDVFSYQQLSKSQGLIGQVWLTGCPTISHNPVEDCFISEQAVTGDLAISLALPIIEDGTLTAVVAFTV